MNRRDIGWIIMRAAAVAGGSEFLRVWLSGAESQNAHLHETHSSAPPDPHNWAAYEPKFFSAGDFRVLDSFTAILVPTDETPGASEAHVSAFIDFVLNAAAEYAPEMQKEWRNAMEWLAAHRFGQLNLEEQIAFVKLISEPERDRSKTHEGFSVYRLLKDMTVHAFYTSRVGLIDVLEYKGLAYLAEFPACTHPEHHRV